MANVVVFWQADGPKGESELKATRIKRVEEIQPLVNEGAKMSQCVRVTVERTGKDHAGNSSGIGYSPTASKLKWLRPGYRSPF